MSKKKEYGICKICGNYDRLTFEHVPPRSTFNRKAAKILRVSDIINADNEDKMPWELNEIHGTISQRGQGGYYLCESCNNNTGAWYGKHYKRFADALLLIALKMQEEDSEALMVEMKAMRPLAIYKQIIAMFCDINGFANTDLKEYILDKENTSIDTNKYRVFMYIPRGDISKQVPLSGKISIGQTAAVLVSEITAFPVGFALYVDLPDTENPKGADISALASVPYNEVTDLVVPLYRLDVNTWLPTDYRSKIEIRQTIEESRAWERDNMLNNHGTAARQ